MTVLMLTLRITLSILAPLLLPPIEAYERWQHRRSRRNAKGGRS
jgi:hypothetical protein